MLSRQLQTPRVLWGAILTSNLLYVVALHVLEGDAHRKQQAPPDGIVMPIFVVAAIVAVVSFALPMTQYRRGLARIELGAGPGRHGEVHLDAAAARRLFVVFYTPFILSLALSTAVSLLGLALKFLGEPWSVAGPLLGAGTLLVLLRFPTLSSVFGPLERARGVRISRAR